MNPYEYHLLYWGSVQNDRWVERDLGITEQDFWFSTAEARAEFKAKLQAVADAHRQIIVFAEHEGCDTRRRTVVRMTFTLPDGRAFQHEQDFGYGFEPETAEYIYFDGNYSCDCNRSQFLSDAGHDVEEMPCGDSIQLTDFVVTKEPTVEEA